MKMGENLFQPKTVGVALALLIGGIVFNVLIAFVIIRTMMKVSTVRAVLVWLSSYVPGIVSVILYFWL